MTRKLCRGRQIKLVLFLMGSSHVAIKLLATGRQLLPAVGNDLGQTVSAAFKMILGERCEDMFDV
jgi:hypothetical protein